ncbi:unnamed protein product [Schistocephalus solidus]|uniref:Fibronectin type-III domain-containing protein n=1 Tax=Schistocephalus solidus TaxID=70667 RepID=A0A183TQX9_SCHSO|nr:unnamed protein product [Schistocephalus solidus]
MMSLKSVIDVSPTSISVTWNEVNVTNALYLAKATADNAVKSTCSCRVPCSGCKLEGLRAGTTYNVRLEICNEYTCTSSSETIEETTVPGRKCCPSNLYTRCELDFVHGSKSYKLLSPRNGMLPET